MESLAFTWFPLLRVAPGSGVSSLISSAVHVNSPQNWYFVGIDPHHSIAISWPLRSNLLKTSTNGIDGWNLPSHQLSGKGKHFQFLMRDVSAKCHNPEFFLGWSTSHHLALSENRVFQHLMITHNFHHWSITEVPRSFASIVHFQT